MAPDERHRDAVETGVSSPGQRLGARLRYWAAAKAAAGVAEEQFPADSVAALIAAAKRAHAHNPRFAEVIDCCSLLIDERPLGTSDLTAVAVGPHSVVDVLPPFAGG